jgi:hypothetical protein
MPVHGVPAPRPRFEPQGHRSERPSPYGGVDAILLRPWEFTTMRPGSACEQADIS